MATGPASLNYLRRRTHRMLNYSRLVPRLVLSAAAMLTAAALGGCATLWEDSGGLQAVPVTSDPPGAVVRINGEVVGTTPLTVSVQSWKPHDVCLELEG